MWPPGTAARVARLGGDPGQRTSCPSVLRTGDVERLPDADCPGDSFDARLDAVRRGHATENPCKGDSGSPLLVPEGGLYALAGVLLGRVVRDPAGPRASSPASATSPLNDWVHARTPEADFDFVSHAAARERAVDADLDVAASRGRRLLHRLQAGTSTTTAIRRPSRRERDAQLTRPAGEAGRRASRPPGPAATGRSIYYSFDVVPDPNVAPAGRPARSPRRPRPAAVAKPAARLATISAAKRPKVGAAGRFTIRVRFARTAPRGIAVVEVFRGKRKIGIARTRVRRGGSKRVTGEAHTDGQAAAAAQHDQAAEGQGARARRAHGAAHEDADDQALGTTGSRGTARAPRA